MSNQNQALIQKRHSQSITFIGVPSAETRKLLASYGFEYRHGSWFKIDAAGEITDEQAIAKLFAA